MPPSSRSSSSPRARPPTTRDGWPRPAIGSPPRQPPTRTTPPRRTGSAWRSASSAAGRRRAVRSSRPACFVPTLPRCSMGSAWSPTISVRPRSSETSTTSVRLASGPSSEAGGRLRSSEITPAESDTGLFGGNSNWRGPIWFPVDYLVIEALERYHHFYGDALRVECPIGSGRLATIGEVAHELYRRPRDPLRPGRDGAPPLSWVRSPLPRRSALARPAALLGVLLRRHRPRARRELPGLDDARHSLLRGSRPDTRDMRVA